MDSTSTETKPTSSDYQLDRIWSDKYLPLVRQIVGPLLLVPAPLENDVSEATDLIILKARDMRIAVRLRRPGYLKYGNQFTFRLNRKSGAETEWSKIRKGFGDWFFYGHTQNNAIIKWYIIDLHKFRDAINLKKYSRDIDFGEQENHDNATSFIWFNSDKFHDCIVASSSKV